MYYYYYYYYHHYYHHYYYFQLTQCSLQCLLCDLGQTFHLSPPGVSTRVTTREDPAAEGGTVGEKCPEMLPKCRLPRYIYVSFTCRKATTWDRRLYFPSEGRRAEDFFALEIRRLRPGANPRTLVPKASTLPLDHRKPLTQQRRNVKLPDDDTRNVETRSNIHYKKIHCCDRGHAVAQLVEALRYKSEGRRFDSRWCHWNFSLA